MRAQPLEDVAQYVLGAAGLLHGLPRYCLRDEFAEIEIEATFEDDTQHADGGTSQRERILRAARLLADGEYAGERIELVGECHGSTRSRAGQRIACAAGLIVLAYRGSDIGMFTVGLRVVGTHDALQFGKLTDHGGEQVAFAEQCGTFGAGRIATERRRDVRSERLHAPDLVTDRSQFGLECDLIEIVTPRRERCPTILLLEERCVRQTWPHDSFVTFAHAHWFAAVDVADRDEERRQCTVGCLDGEVALMFLQRGEQYFSRQGEKALIETPDDCHRPLDERGHFIEQRLIEHRLASLRRSTRRDLLADRFAAFGERGDDVTALAQDLGVARRGIDLDPLGGVEPMTATTTA